MCGCSAPRAWMLPMRGSPLGPGGKPGGRRCFSSCRTTSASSASTAASSSRQAPLPAGRRPAADHIAPRLPAAAGSPPLLGGGSSAPRSLASGGSAPSGGRAQLAGERCPLPAGARSRPVPWRGLGSAGKGLAPRGLRGCCRVWSSARSRSC